MGALTLVERWPGARVSLPHHPLAPLVWVALCGMRSPLFAAFCFLCPLDIVPRPGPCVPLWPSRNSFSAYVVELVLLQRHNGVIIPSGPAKTVRPPRFSLLRSEPAAGTSGAVTAGLTGLGALGHEAPCSWPPPDLGGWPRSAGANSHPSARIPRWGGPREVGGGLLLEMPGSGDRSAQGWPGGCGWPSRLCRWKV